MRSITALLFAALACWFTVISPALADPDDNWSSQFIAPGPNGLVKAILFMGTDMVIAGGFTTVDGVDAPLIARWDGASWSALGGGLDDTYGNEVRALALRGNDLYAGGRFQYADGSPAQNIARWDGTSWQPLIADGYSGLNQHVQSLALDASGNLYIAFDQTAFVGYPISGATMWDGSTFNALGGGLTLPAGGGYGNAILVDGGDVYVGGTFDHAGGVPAENVAMWDGASWAALGSGLPANVWAFAFYNGELHAGSNSLWRWDGVTWNEVGGGISQGSDVRALGVRGGDLIVAGWFTKMGSQPVSKPVRWNGSSWIDMDRGLGSIGLFMSAVCVSPTNEVFVGSGFEGSIDGVASRNMIKWDGNSWVSTNGPNLFGLVGSANVVTVDGADAYFGGDFAYHVAHWDGSAMHTLGAGMNGTVRDIAVGGADVYVGGDFTSADQVNSPGVARWDGSAWHAMGIDGQVYTLLVDDGDVYAGGYLGVGLRGRVFRRDGSSWTQIAQFAPDPSLNSSEEVHDLVTFGADIVAGGLFYEVDGVPANNIARWDGTAWSPLGTGTNRHVLAMCVMGSDLYVAGTFTTAGGQSASKVARWDGTNWYGLGGYIANDVLTLTPFGSSLYVGGLFTSVAFMPMNHVAVWDNGTWSPLGSGTDGEIRSLAAYDGSILVAGEFSHAGGKVSSNVGQWTVQSSTDVGSPAAVGGPRLANYPNPFNPRTTFRYRINQPGRVTLRIYDAHGRRVRTVVDRFESAASQRVAAWDGLSDDGNACASGVYFALLKSPGGEARTKVVLLK